MPSTIHVAMASDDGYARPLAVAAHSLIRNLSPDRSLVLHLLDCGITQGNADRIEASLKRPGVEINWIGGISNEIAELPVASWISTATYARLLLPKLLPGITKVLYLDCDLIVRACVGELFDDIRFEIRQETRAAMAVQDMGSPTVASKGGLAKWHKWGREAGDPNFNAGVMLINLDYWRTQDVAEEALDYLRTHHQLNHDQEALNYVIGQRTVTLDAHWNQQPDIFDGVSSLFLPYTDALIQSIRANPKIVHFSTNPKPWVLGAEHPYRNEWFHYLDHTGFAFWRPDGPSPKEIVRDGLKRLAKRLGL